MHEKNMIQYKTSRIFENLVFEYFVYRIKVLYNKRRILVFL